MSDHKNVIRLLTTAGLIAGMAHDAYGLGWGAEPYPSSSQSHKKCGLTHKQWKKKKAEKKNRKKARRKK